MTITSRFSVKCTAVTQSGVILLSIRKKVCMSKEYLEIFEEQLDKLKYFYFESLLPELACPRHCKGGLREPKHSV